MIYVIYARYSSDGQNPKSVEDQIDVCEKHIYRRYGPNVRTKAFWDCAKTGRDMNRDGINRALAYVELYAPDAVLFAESLDRFSRNLRDVANIYYDCVALNVEMATLTRDKIGLIDVGLVGTMNAMQIDNMVMQVKRGQKAKVKRGLSAGGLAYGYDKDRSKLDSNGDVILGERKINPEQAKIVVRIFEQYAAGGSAKKVAELLNGEGTPSPSGGRWSAGGILGNIKTGSGLINNELYKGVLVYGKTKVVRRQGKKKWAVNDDGDTIRVAREDLRIVSDELWNKARQRRLLGKEVTNRVYGKPPISPGRRPTALTGFVFCGRCGSPATLSSRKKYLCTSAMRKTGCVNWRRLPLDAALEEIRKEVADRAKDMSASRWAAAVGDSGSDESKKLVELRGRLREIEKHGDQLVDLMVAGVRDKKIKKKLLELNDEKERCKGDIKAIREIRGALVDDPVKLTSRAVETIIRRIHDLEAREYVRELMRLSIKRVTYLPIADKPKGVTIRVEVNDECWPRLAQVMVEDEPKPADTPQADRRPTRFERVV